MRRASAHGGLLLGVVVTALTAAALFAALASVGGGALSRSVVQRVAAMKPSDTNVTVSGPTSAANLPQIDTALRDLLRITVGSRPFTVDRAEIGRALNLQASSGGPSSTRIITPVAASAVADHATVVSGTWPTPPRPGAPVDVAMPLD